jgi:hypothetical protein
MSSSANQPSRALTSDMHEIAFKVQLVQWYQLVNRVQKGTHAAKSG